ncbi:MAG TPA: glutamine--fructose-6-phosphate transaminase (isomerizing) [Patescibacteria group bacterium]|jgi:glucosamine--fructose-6-phosphate aminotransferase (isomerizing)|nr:glutamine--fructose-6-phosphate transaminase (isomerizing) [Patescibacteria group bacterium]
MCGIVGYIGPKQAQSVLLSGLARLEYRGYDSAGIATISPRSKVTLLRTKGKVAELAHRIDGAKKSDTIGIGHTRWATHGEPSKRNAHPHAVGDIYLVHNGIIENYQDIKAMLAEHDYDMKSDTDSEVLAALIEYLSSSYDTLVETVSAALKMVVGAYGIAVVDSKNPDEIVVARNGSPLVLGLGDGEVFIASDASAIVGHTDQVVYLRDNELAVCRRTGIELYDLDIRALDTTVETLELDLQAIQKQGYEHFLLKEIHEQPDTVRATLSGRVRLAERTARLGGINMTDAELRAVKHVFIVGCGTAYYAGLLAKYYTELLTDDVVVSVETASELRYRSFAVPENSVALIVSQSGETADTLACLSELQRRGVRCLGVVNAVGSSIARQVDGGVYLHVGSEISVASTKAFTSQVVAMIIFAIMLAESKGSNKTLVREFVEELDLLPAQIEQVLEDHLDTTKQLADRYTHYEHSLYVGRDALYPVALEGALKLKEISYIHAEGYAAGELKHGPIALIDERFFEVYYIQDNWLYEKSQSNLIEMNARGAHAIAITDSDKKLPAESVVRVHTKLQHLTPLVFNVVSQLIAYHMAVSRGNDVDQPRNLAKSVTVE